MKKPSQQLVLSLFPGVDLLGRAFAHAGFVVVRGPDLITGDDIAQFRGIANRFDGVIAGPPCQGFSTANRHRGDRGHPSVVRSIDCLREFARVVGQCGPTWWLCENVPGVPDVRVLGYHVQRVAIADDECGGPQLRMRHVQFGHVGGLEIRPHRATDAAATETRARRDNGPKTPAATTKPCAAGVTFSEQCAAQGLDKMPDLPGWTTAGKMRAVGNGVSMHVGRALADAVAALSVPTLRVWERLCACGCGRPVDGRSHQQCATITCRKRVENMRHNPRPYVDADGWHDAPQPILESWNGT